MPLDSGNVRSVGRGAYYKAKYGRPTPPMTTPLGQPGVSHELGPSSGNSLGSPPLPRPFDDPPPRPMEDSLEHPHTELTSALKKINGKQYGAYRQLYGKYRFRSSLDSTTPEFVLSVEHVQADAFAPPSRFRAIVPMSLAKFPQETYHTEIRKTALCDYITRRVASLLGQKDSDPRDPESAEGPKPSFREPKGGEIIINAPSQQVLKRNSVLIRHSPAGLNLEMRIQLGLPAAGRTILGDKAADVLTVMLPQLVKKGLYWSSYESMMVLAHIKSVEDQEFLRKGLDRMGLVAFIGNGSILPRKSGISPLPMTGPAVVPFKSPSSLEVTINTPNAGPIRGMGIKRGITLLTGGGFHGKSTLLEALETGVYNHVKGDGRETVVTSNAVKIRAEDGRSVASCNLTPYIGTLPGSKSTESFTSSDASGSTSMAANIQESLELGATTLLLDEDSCATNLLVKDKRMEALIPNEPLTPLVAKVESLFRERSVSTILVIGGCGDYLSVANTVICLDSYVAHDFTERAREISRQFPLHISSTPNYGGTPTRVPKLPPFHQFKAPKARDIKRITSDVTPDIDLSGLNQLVETGQARLCAEILRYIARQQNVNPIRRAWTMKQWREFIEAIIGDNGGGNGLDHFHGDGWLVGDWVEIRGYEVMAAVNRIRGLKANANGQ